MINKIKNNLNRIKKNIVENKKLSILYGVLSILAIIYFNYDLVFTVNNIPDMWKNGFLLFTILVSVTSFITIMSVIHEKKIHKQFFILAIALGLLYTLTVPLMQGTDDFSHYYKVVELSEGNLVGNKETTIPAAFKNFIGSSTNSENIMDKLFKTVDYSERELQVTNNASLYGPAQYIPQVLGFWVARLIMVGPYMYGVLAKVFNLIYFVIFATLSIKIIPFKKEFLFVLLLSPAVLSLVGTMTCDSVIIGTSMLFISYILNIKHNNTKITNKNLAILLGLGIILALCKSVYAPIIGIMLLLINKKTDKKDIMKSIAIILICAVISVGWYVSTSKLTSTVKDVDFIEKQHAQVEFVKNNPLEYLIINSRLFINDGYYYLSNLIGGNEMCYSAARIPTLIIFMYLLLLIQSFLSDKKNLKLNIIQKVFIFSIVFFIIALSCYVMYTEWTILFTEIGGPTIVGVQSRYFLVLLPLVMLLINLKNEYELENNKLLTSCTFLNICSIFSVFITMLAGRFGG